MITLRDHDDFKKITRLVAEALQILHDFESRHGLDLTGPALSALGRADVSLSFVPREIQQAERYLDV